MVARNFAWLATNGGAWSLAANWNDITDGINPSLIVPGSQDSVSVTGPVGSSIQTITSQGAVMAASFAGNTALAGTFSATTLTLGANGAGGLLTVASGSLSDGTIDISSGSMLASGAGSRLAATGALSLGDANSNGAACNLDATSGGSIRAGSLILGAVGAAIYVDPSSVIEVGTAGGAATGTLTIDAGAGLAGQGNANAYGAVANNGTILATGGLLVLGSVSGQGTLQIDSGAVLELNGVTAAGQAVQFTGSDATLAIATEFDAPKGTLSLFAPGDAIEMLGSPISAATYQTTGSNLGVLTLWYGSQVADTLTLAGNYSGDVFLTAGDGGLGTLITVAPETNGTGGASQGTSGPDVYQWAGAGSGNWNSKLNWADVTKQTNPANVAPGVNNLVSIDASGSGSFLVIAGPANAAALALTGDVALAGTFSIGTLTVGDGVNDISATLDLLPATLLATPSAALAYGEISVSGGGVLAVGGTLVMGGGPLGVGLPTTQLSATAGGTITAAALTLGGGAGDQITTDPTGVIEIGTARGAIAGAVTVDSGAMLSGNGTINPYGAIVDNGTILATGGVLTVGNVTGAGVLNIDANAGLEIISGNAMSLGFIGNGAVLLLANELVSLTGTISGFVPGEAIDIENDPITATSTSFNGSNTILSLYYGSVVVNRLTLAGSYKGSHFVLVPDGGLGTYVLVAGGGGGGGGNGQGNTDLMQWANPVSGAWSNTNNWFDVTTNAPALAPPGAQNSVIFVGPTGVGIQTIAGPGLCAKMGFFGNSLLSRAFAAGTLTIGGYLNGTLTPGTVDVTNIGASSSLTATAQGTIADGTLVVGTGGVLSVGGTLSVGDGVPGDSSAYSLLSVTSSGTAVLGGLALGGGAGAAVQTDATGVIEIGTAGGAAAGAVTIDNGVSVAGNGLFNIGGLVVVNGTLTASGGTLAVGAASGTGTLAIATEATLALNSADIVPIAFTGAGATLLLEGSQQGPAAPISGFVQGDFIVTGSSQVTSVQYAPGAGNLGTLTMYYGSQVAGTLLLAGDFAGDNFTLQPDGAGTEIGVQQAGGGGPSQGTPTPDAYAWIGGAGTSWNNARNWQDLTTGQNPAPIAPGAHNLDTVLGGTGSNYTTIVGPANAAALTLDGNVALSGIYAVGTLSVGEAGVAGVLAMGSGGALQAAAAVVYGDVVLSGGGFSSGGLLSLAGGVLVAGQHASVLAGTLALSGVGTALTVDSLSSVEVGSAGGAAAGALTVDAGAIAYGAGALDPLGNIVVQGTITASGGTLSVGNVSGSGTLLVGVGADLALQGSVAAATLIDFAGPGTLSVQGVLPAAYIADFGNGDQIFVPVSGVTDAEYAPTGPNVGVLSLFAGSSVVATLNLVGVGAGQSFAASANAGGTVITTQQTYWGEGGDNNMGNQGGTEAQGGFGIVQDQPFWASLPAEAKNVLAAEQAQNGNEAWVDVSGNGSSWDNPAPAVANFAVVSEPAPRSTVALPLGYSALLAQGQSPVWLTDGGAGGALLVGNAGNDTISASGYSAPTTMVGGTGNTLFFAQYTAAIWGGGNDTIITGVGPCAVTTAVNARSTVWLGPSQNNVVSQGHDTILAGAGPGSNDTIWAVQSDLIFGANVGRTSVTTGNGPSTVVSGAGEMSVRGGAGNGSIIWGGAGSLLEFAGGAGSATIVGGTGQLSVQGGGGALTVFGGSGASTIEGAPGPSFYLVGEGASTVNAADGNRVWLVGNANDSLTASGGNIILNGSNSGGNNSFQAGSGPCTILGGYGNDTMVGGAGAAIMVGGGGSDVFSFTNGLAGGSDTVYGFNAANDRLELHGYTSYGANVVNGSEVITLSDGTDIVLSGIGNLAGVTINLS